MLGQFLEVARVTDATGAAWQQLQQLGFEPAATGDVWPHEYGVVAAQGLAIGLHSRGEDEFSLVFVRPDVAALHRELETRGIEVDSARLGSDVFNELTLRDPDGLALKVLEARSFSPPARLRARTVPGTFRMLSLPARDIDSARAFWTALGASCDAAAAPLAGFAIGATPLACHEQRDFAAPLLVFDSPEAEAAQMLTRLGFELRRPLAALPATPHLLARGCGLSLLMLEAT